MKNIVLQQNQHKWIKDFVKEKQKLSENLAFLSFPLEFYHIGSTSIPHCLAKPIIDILGVVPDITLLDSYHSLFEKLGYEVLGEFGIEQRRFYKKSTNTPVNLHIFEESDPQVERHLRFRKHLSHHPEKVQAYGEIKQQLQEQERDLYTLGKSPFIKEMDRAAAFEIPYKLAAPLNGEKKKEWTPVEIGKALEVNLHLFMSYFAFYIPTVEIVYENDIQVVRGQIPDSNFNILMGARFTPTDCPERVRALKKHYLGLPYSWWVGPTDTPSNLEQELEKQGFKYTSSTTGMYFSLDNYIPITSAVPLDIQRILTPKKLEDFTTLYPYIGGHPQAYEQIFSQLPPVLYMDGACYEIYVGYFQKQPVVTGVLVCHANVAGIYYITTIPEARKKGLATQMMHHLLKRAQSKGYHLSILLASAEGQPLYEKLGFQPLSCYKEYSLCESL